MGRQGTTAGARVSGALRLRRGLARTAHTEERGCVWQRACPKMLPEGVPLAPRVEDALGDVLCRRAAARAAAVDPPAAPAHGLSLCHLLHRVLPPESHAGAATGILEDQRQDHKHDARLGAVGVRAGPACATLDLPALSQHLSLIHI